MKNKSLHLECLVQVQSFEKLWAYYNQSSGLLYSKECREAAIQLLISFNQLKAEKAEFPKGIQCFDDGKMSPEFNPITILKKWGEDENELSFEDVRKIKAMIFMFLCEFKKYLLEKLKIKYFPKMIFSTMEEEYSARVIRWRPHMPRIALLHNPDLLFSQASDTPTIAVVGDIRRSQELMVYAGKPEEFSSRWLLF